MKSRIVFNRAKITRVYELQRFGDRKQRVDVECDDFKFGKVRTIHTHAILSSSRVKPKGKHGPDELHIDLDYAVKHSLITRYAPMLARQVPPGKVLRQNLGDTPRAQPWTGSAAQCRIHEKLEPYIERLWHYGEWNGNSVEQLSKLLSAFLADGSDHPWAKQRE